MSDDSIDSTILAGGESWRWQLRDRRGRWIEMGAEVKWIANGLTRTGTVVDSPAPDTAEVEETKTKRRLRLKTRMLTVVEKIKGAKETEAKGGSQPEPDTIPAAVKESKATVRAPSGAAAAPMPKAQQDRLNAGAEKWAKYTPPAGGGEKESLFRKAWSLFKGNRDENGYAIVGTPYDPDTVAERGNSQSDPIYVGTDVALAQRLLLMNKHIRMESQQDAIKILTPEFAKQIKKQNPKLNMCLVGVQGGNLFCKDNKGIPRALMPQLAGDDKETGDKKNIQPWAEEMLDTLGLISPVEDADVNTLMASQSELGTDQIIGMADAGLRDWNLTRKIMEARKAGDLKEAEKWEAERARARNLHFTDPEYAMDMSVLTDAILVTDDGYVIDGHHRWAALLVLNNALDEMGVPPIQMSVRRVRMEIGEALATINAFADAGGIKPKTVKSEGSSDIGAIEIEIPPILKDSKPSKSAMRWTKENMAKVIAELAAITPNKDPDQVTVKDIWAASAKAKEKQVRSKSLLSSALEPGANLYLDGEVVTVMLRPIVASGVVAVVGRDDSGTMRLMHFRDGVEVPVLV